MTLLAVAAFAAFASGRDFPDVSVLLLAAAILATSGVAFTGWKQSPRATLRWDGQHWFWSGFMANPVCELRLLMDFQRVVLVTVVADAHAPVYLWLEAVPGDTSWKPLRRAIVSSQMAVSGGGKKATLPVDRDIA